MKTFVYSLLCCLLFAGISVAGTVEDAEAARLALEKKVQNEAPKEEIVAAKKAYRRAIGLAAQDKSVSNRQLDNLCRAGGVGEGGIPNNMDAAVHNRGSILQDYTLAEKYKEAALRVGKVGILQKLLNGRRLSEEEMVQAFEHLVGKPEGNHALKHEMSLTKERRASVIPAIWENYTAQKILVEPLYEGTDKTALDWLIEAYANGFFTLEETKAMLSTLALRLRVEDPDNLIVLLNQLKTELDILDEFGE